MLSKSIQLFISINRNFDREDRLQAVVDHMGRSLILLGPSCLSEFRFSNNKGRRRKTSNASNSSGNGKSANGSFSASSPRINQRKYPSISSSPNITPKIGSNVSSENAVLSTSYTDNRKDRMFSFDNVKASLGLSGSSQVSRSVSQSQSLSRVENAGFIALRKALSGHSEGSFSGVSESTPLENLSVLLAIESITLSISSSNIPTKESIKLDSSNHSGVFVEVVSHESMRDSIAGQVSLAGGTDVDILDDYDLSDAIENTELFAIDPLGPIAILSAPIMIPEDMADVFGRLVDDVVETAPKQMITDPNFQDLVVNEFKAGKHLNVRNSVLTRIDTEPISMSAQNGDDRIHYRKAVSDPSKKTKLKKKKSFFGF